ncbi:MAG: hypothetical protein JO269_09740 [Burkholderiaceae bacterium]|nr:hypothetical protein [Burkholderiaceae bacterium]
MNQSSSKQTMVATSAVTGAVVVVEFIINEKLKWGLSSVGIVAITGWLTTVAHFLTNVISELWAKYAKDHGLEVPASSVEPANPVPAAQAGFARIGMLLALAAIAGACLTLTGCGALNTYVAAKDANLKQDYAGAKKNVQDVDDQELTVWKDTACAIKVGALQRNPGDVSAVMAACPLTNVAKVTVANGAVTLEAPGVVPLAQGPLAALSQPSASEQLMSQILQSLQAIQAQTAPKPVAPAAKAVQRQIPAPVKPVAPPAIAPSPQPILPTSSAPVPVPAPIPSAPTAGLKSFLTPPSKP